MRSEEYKTLFREDEAVGWQCIDLQLEKIYGSQKPLHLAPAIYYSLGGNDPLDGISIYTSDKQCRHYHFITYGFSELYYDESSAGADFSKFGFELTFRLKIQEENVDINWPCNLLQNIARYVFQSGRWFKPFQFIPVNGPIRAEYDTEITALVFCTDPELGKIDTPNGEVNFLQMVGITTAELELLKQNPTASNTEQLLEKLKASNELLITDLERRS